MKLTVCANIFPIESFYNWQEKLTKDREVVMIARTVKKNIKKIETFVEDTHSYDVPFIGWWRLDGLNKEYKDWAEQVLK